MSKHEKSTPRLIVIMGVSGSGKSSLAKAVAERCGFCYLDGDDFHTEEARSLMANGIPLTDEIRAPWIDFICQHLQQLANKGQNCVLAFSGLKKVYREPLRRIGFNVTFLFLDGDRETIQQRLEKRKGHFMPPELLNSQFETLERPSDEADVLRLDVALSLEQMVNKAVTLLG